MIWALTIGAACIVLVAVGVVLLIRRFRNLQLVSPILLDDALDPDLRRLRRALLRRPGLSAQRRREIGQRVIEIQARRVSGGAGGDEAVEEAWRVLRRR
jgi:hypothetical protein